MKDPHKCIGRLYRFSTGGLSREKYFNFLESNTLWYPADAGTHTLGLIHLKDLLICEGREVLRPPLPFPDAASLGAQTHQDMDILMFHTVNDALEWKTRNPGRGSGTGRVVWLLDVS